MVSSVEGATARLELVSSQGSSSAAQHHHGHRLQNISVGSSSSGIRSLSRSRQLQHPQVQFVEQFVSDVVDFSSQYGNNSNISYTAYNIAGNPSKFPDYGDFPQAFVMRTYGKWWDRAPSKCLDYMPQNNGPVVSHDYIDLSFSKDVYPVRISIYETYNPGSVVAIWARDEDGRWTKLWNGPPQIVPHKPRIFSPPLQQINFKTKILRLEFNHSLLDYYTELDAVQLIGTTELIVPNLGPQPKNLTGLLRELGDNRPNDGDSYNLTPNYFKCHHDIHLLKSSLHKYWDPCKSKNIERVPKGRLVAKLGLHCHHIPPYLEAYNSLHKLLEDFPKIIEDINNSSSKSQILSETDLNVNDNISSSFAALPDETILKIFKYLDIRSLCRVSQVNRHFNNISRDCLLYRSLNLKPYWHCIDASVLNNLISKCQYLQRLDLSWCGNYDMISSDNFIAFLQSSGNSLTHLRLNCCKFVNDAVIEKISSICQNLKELKLRNCTSISNNGFTLLENLENLEILDLYRTMIETDKLCAILRKNTRLKHLNLAGMHDCLNMDEVATEIAASCLNLESIDCWKAQTLTVNGLRALTNCSNLREVDFGWCTGIGPLGDSLRVFLGSCKKLEKVFLTSFRGLTDRDLEPLLFCRNLQQLDLVGARFLSPEFCIKLLCYLQLQMIDLSFCDGISDSKINEWRKLYPHVSIKRNFTSNR
ncbi:hypothetical protein TKK_0006797 [Trichogramma kaykai]|uniref:F-box domain-containing protein n=1 Tax=Trichogramma kaykai TaxID=54128 RepID=A0ABD2XC73_9HYME